MSVDPSPNVLREYIDAQVCPWCQGGPYKRLASHTWTAHQILGDELRRMAGLSSKARICSQEASDDARARLLAMPNREEITRRGHEASMAAGAITTAKDASVAKTMVLNAAKHKRIVELFQRQTLIQDIAAEVGMDRSSVIRVLRRSGLVTGPLWSERWANPAYAERFRKSLEKRKPRTSTPTEAV